MRTRRNARGGAITFSVVLAFIIVLVGCAFLLFAFFMGGEAETKNAVDAGVLNVGRKALDQISVDLGLQANQRCFQDITSDTNDVSAKTDDRLTLKRVNRMWGKALLMGINADAAEKDLQAGSMESNAQSAFAGATELSNQLAAKLTDEGNLHQFFSDYARANSVRMVGNNASVQVVAGANWQTSLMDRGDESNIVLNGQPPNFNLPPGYVLDGNAFTKCTRTPVPSGAANLFFLKGYTPIVAAGSEYWQVPFQFDQKPHMVSKGIFDASTKAKEKIDWDNPVPNAFSGEGATSTTSTGLKAVSWVLTNPRQPFQLSMPHSFLRIHLDDMKAHWIFFPAPFGLPPTEFGAPTPYGYTTDFGTGEPMPGGGILCTTVEPDEVLLGTEVVGQTLDGVIFSEPMDPATKASVEGYITNRVNEMVTVPGKSISVQKMHTILDDFKTTGAMILGVRDFFVFSLDGENVVVAPALPPWLATQIGQKPDGSEHEFQDDQFDTPPFFPPPIITPVVGCTQNLDLCWLEFHKTLAWTPGSGFNGCLGTVRVNRSTKVFNLGVCNPF